MEVWLARAGGIEKPGTAVARIKHVANVDEDGDPTDVIREARIQPREIRKLDGVGVIEENAAEARHRDRCLEHSPWPKGHAAGHRVAGNRLETIPVVRAAA